jgi:hypothetical protein
MKDFLEGLGIHVGLSVAGFFGSLLMVGKSSAFDLRTTFTSIIAGVTSANYLTPVVVDMLRLQGTDYVFSIAFIIGFIGLKGVELASNKLFKGVK